MEKETLVATVQPAESADEQQLTAQVTDIEFRAESLVIQNDEDYASTSAYGHFGNTIRDGRTWERADKVPALLSEIRGME